VAGWVKPLLGIVVSPFLGMTLGLILSVTFSWSLWRQNGRFMQWLFRKLQLGSAALYSLSHGSNDAQKTMGIIVGLLVSSQGLFAEEKGFLHRFYLASPDHMPTWIVMSCYAAIAAGTAMGGWRIVRTMGMRITRLRPFDGFCAETGGAVTIFFASSLGVPVSTTHTITGAIVGVGASKRLGAVRWGVARRIVWAWVMTIPAAAAIAAITYLVLPK
jgi:PiT family inorganic phosphate transporter